MGVRAFGVTHVPRLCALALRALGGGTALRSSERGGATVPCLSDSSVTSTHRLHRILARRRTARRGPGVEDGACAQLLCICDPSVESG